MTMCTFGAAPCSMVVLPDLMVMVEGKPAANISACTPANIPTFGMCMTLSNPQVAAATAAALGVLTPMPCVPVLTPWIPVSETMLGGMPALTEGATCICSWGGEISITFPGSVKSLY